MDAKETLRVGDRLGQLRNGDRGGVGADDGVRAGGRADAGQGLVLDRDDFRDGFLDEVGVRHCLLDVLRGPEVLLQDFRGAFGEQSVCHELVGFRQEAFVVLLRHLCGHVGEGDSRPAEGQHLGDAAAHVTGSDDGVLAGAGGCFGHGQSAFV